MQSPLAKRHLITDYLLNRSLQLNELHEVRGVFDFLEMLHKSLQLQLFIPFDPEKLPRTSLLLHFWLDDRSRLDTFLRKFYRGRLGWTWTLLRRQVRLIVHEHVDMLDV
jgi:hypothetical protein